MLSIKFIREQPDTVRDTIRRKNQDDKLPLVDEALKLDEQHRSKLQESEQLRAQRNSISKQIAQAKKEGKDAKDLFQRAKDIPDQIKALEADVEQCKKRLDEITYQMPNILHPDVKAGKDDSQDVELSLHGDPKVPDFDIKNHAELMEEMGLADFDASARVAGNGFFYLLGDLALLNQALQQYAVKFMVEKGYTLVEPPLMTNLRVLTGTTPLHEIEQQAYKIDKEDLYLIATSEFPLIGMFIDQQVVHTRLPLRLCGISPCFRKEIGSHGIDEKGLFRTHQFYKVEQIVICNPEDSWEFYDEMLNNSIELFEGLQIPVRVLEMCSGDTSDLKMRQADLEAWSPRRKELFEVCSCSNLGDNQARLLNIKIRHHDGNYYPHTLNDTAIATSRAMVAILENNQQADGSVVIPKVLQEYMGKQKLEPREKLYE